MPMGQSLNQLVPSGGTALALADPDNRQRLQEGANDLEQRRQQAINGWANQQMMLQKTPMNPLTGSYVSGYNPATGKMVAPAYKGNALLNAIQGGGDGGGE